MTNETTETHGAATLEIIDLHAEVEGKEILKGIDLVVKQGETHALMGPNGSGKSTLSNVIMGRPGYTVTQGKVVFKGDLVTGVTTTTYTVPAIPAGSGMLGTAITGHPAAWAEAMPRGESSSATHPPGASPSSAAARR